MAKPAALHQCRVLLADDDPFVRTVYAQTLRTRGCEVTEASGGEQAVSLARALLPDLVLLDLSMPGMDGWETLAAVRAGDLTRELVVVALTATDTQAIRERAAAAGFDGFVVKPFTAPVLVRELEAVWARVRPGDPPLSAPPAQSRVSPRAGSRAVTRCRPA